MPVREILQLGNPLLRQKAEALRDVDSAEAKSAVVDLRDTLRAFRESNRFGRAIAAPQIGISLRLLYVEMPDGPLSGPIFNPVITSQSSETLLLWDDCLSFPDLLVRLK
ncbi:MAG: peptide deformylase, partial [candidate division Zixibacteria bacterium]